MKLNNNIEVRTALKEKKVPYWMIAEELGVSENTVTRWMRHELDQETKQRVLDIIAAI